jgi:hypothetical protein
MKTDALTNLTVKAAIEALQTGDRKAWSALFEPDAEPYDDGSPRSLEEYTRDALESRAVHFQLSSAGKIKRLDIGQAT